MAALRAVAAWVAANGLTLHPDKTRIGDSRQPGQGFDFLGYRFEAGRRFVRKKSLKAFKDKVRAKTGRSRGDSLERIIADLNPMLRGWFGYFKHAMPPCVHASRRLRPATAARHPAQAEMNYAVALAILRSLSRRAEGFCRLRPRHQHRRG